MSRTLTDEYGKKMMSQLVRVEDHGDILSIRDKLDRSEYGSLRDTAINWHGRRLGNIDTENQRASSQV